MADDDVDDPALKEERLKSALWYAIGQIVDHETLITNHNATPQFIGALTELVWAQIASAARDLETFAQHAGRTTITTDDVLLLARRNEGLETLLRGFVEQLRVAEGRSGGGKRVSSGGRGGGGGAGAGAGAGARGRGRGRGRGRS